jgi:SAM-dependent methyltransferase
MAPRYDRAVEPKPRGWGSDYAAWFDAPSVAARYVHRPPYPPPLFPLLAGLAAAPPRAVLDAGCGPGDLARSLATLVGRVDAVDRSPRMLAEGRRLPGGDAGNLRWILGEVEDVPLDPPYALVVAGESVHWFDWRRAMPRFADVLADGGALAIVYRDWLGAGQLRRRLIEVYGRHGANPDYAPLDPVEELERRGLFERRGEEELAAVPWRPTRDELLACHHSQNGFVTERMRDPEGFDRELTAVVDALAAPVDGRYRMQVSAGVVWGVPTGRAQSG